MPRDLAPETRRDLGPWPPSVGSCLCWHLPGTRCSPEPRDSLCQVCLALLSALPSASGLLSVVPNNRSRHPGRFVVTLCVCTSALGPTSPSALSQLCTRRRCPDPNGRAARWPCQSIALTFDRQNYSPHHHDERLQGIGVDHSGQASCGGEGAGGAWCRGSRDRGAPPGLREGLLLHIQALPSPGWVSGGRRQLGQHSRTTAVQGCGGWWPCLLLMPVGSAGLSDSGRCPPGCTNAQPSGQDPLSSLPPHRAWRCTCDGVQGGDGEHEDGGQVEVPAQADVHEQSPRIQVDLGGKGICVEARGDHRVSEPPTAARSPSGLSALWMRDPTCQGLGEGGGGPGRATAAGTLVLMESPSEPRSPGSSLATEPSPCRG